MRDKLCWLLYEDTDYVTNRDFADLCAKEGQKRGLSIVPVQTSQLVLGMDESGQAYVLQDGLQAHPDAVLSRQRSSLISHHLEAAGIPVFNSAAVCAICNDKRRTLQFLHGLPMLHSQFIMPQPSLESPPGHVAYPAVVKPAHGHGGQGVALVRNEADWHEAASGIAPDAPVWQAVADSPGKDLRIYVVFGRIVAAVMRTAPEGFISNYKKGGHVALHTLTEAERSLAMQVIQRFQQKGVELCFAGIDFLYHRGRPVVSEVEDVVGSRMLYHVSDLNIAALFLEEVAQRLHTGGHLPK